ncbi:hypothetical protein N7527_011890 [Penicillium freii]|nr:hypothetical protein N7527_011890 [Penicillium freii]
MQQAFAFSQTGKLVVDILDSEVEAQGDYRSNELTAALFWELKSLLSMFRTQVEDLSVDMITSNEFNLSVLSNGEEATHLSFDRILKACSTTVTQHGIIIFCDWVEQNENTPNLIFYSYPVKYVALGAMPYEDWNRAAMYLQNAISFTV